MGYSRINWKEVAALAIRDKSQDWNWQKPRTRSKVKFIPNPASTMPVEHVYGSANTSGSRDDKSCVVNALANVTGMPWFMAQRAWAAAGRKPNRGTAISVQKVRCGYKFRKVTRKPTTLAKFVASHPVGRFYIELKTHSVALVNGKLHDWLKNGNRKIVEAAYSVKVNNRE